MLDVSAARINQHSPYTVIESKEGDFVFHSKNGTDYSVAFLEEMPVGGCTTYQVSIAKINNVHGSHDFRIKDTVFAIIEDFFTYNQDVLLYICDTTDGREENRNRLFMRWFHEFYKADDFTIKTANATVEGIGFYAAIIVKNTNPLLKSIIEDFETTSAHLSK